MNTELLNSLTKFLREFEDLGISNGYCQLCNGEVLGQRMGGGVSHEISCPHHDVTIAIKNGISYIVNEKGLKLAERGRDE